MNVSSAVHGGGRLREKIQSSWPQNSVVRSTWQHVCLHVPARPGLMWSDDSAEGWLRSWTSVLVQSSLALPSLRSMSRHKAVPSLAEMSTVRVKEVVNTAVIRLQGFNKGGEHLNHYGLRLKKDLKWSFGSDPFPPIIIRNSIWFWVIILWSD